MKITDHNILVDKAKVKKDGIYSYKGYTVVVKNKNFIAYCDRYGSCFRVNGSFHTSVGQVEPYPYKIKAALKQYMK